MLNASLDLPFSHNVLLELAGSWRPLFSLHAGTAEPLRVSPPEAVVYRDLIKNSLQETTRIVGGVDTHKDLHVAAVVDEEDHVLGAHCFASGRRQHKLDRIS